MKDAIEAIWCHWTIVEPMGLWVPYWSSKKERWKYSFLCGPLETDMKGLLPTTTHSWHTRSSKWRQLVFFTWFIKSGYWQVGMHPNNRETTAFTAWSGLWQFYSRSTGISMRRLLPGYSYDERLQLWYQWTSWVVCSWQKLVSSLYIVQSQRCTLSPVYQHDVI